jgi:hypothetical protein
LLYIYLMSVLAVCLFWECAIWRWLIWYSIIFTKWIKERAQYLSTL